MKLVVSKDAAALGAAAAKHTAQLLRKAIEKRGEARLILSTGASQFTTLEALVKEDVDWSKVEMFHLDEYVDLPVTHPASFVKYLQERFVDQVGQLKAVHFVDTRQDVPELIGRLTKELDRSPVDVGLIGIGENGHIAFNDPPADFENTNSYIIVNLDDRCRRQQLGEGWFPTIDDVPRQAVSMTVPQILKCRHIISAVPHEVKAEALQNTFEKDVTPLVPATILKTHEDATVYADENSAKKLSKEIREKFQ